jgi:hypothetical protein
VYFVHGVVGGGSCRSETMMTTRTQGPAYFGFVRDTSGGTIPDAKVTVGIANRGGVVTRTDALGAYKVPGFGKEVDPGEVVVSCEKEGYKQIKVLRRNTPTALNIPIIETECTLQRS